MDNIHLKRVEGQYYLTVDGDLIPITEEEAILILADKNAVYDVIINKRRKFNFNIIKVNISIRRLLISFFL